MTFKLFIQALGKFLIGLVVISFLLFLPAGSMKYWNAWLFLIILFVPMFFAGIILMIMNPELLKKRLNAKEEEKEQKVVIVLSGVMFVSAFIIAGLNYRFGWFEIPKWAVLIGTLVFMLSYVLYAEVLRENAFLSRTIEIQNGQKVIDTGLYGIIRHPMYSATLFLFLSMGIVLGSPASFLILLSYIPIIVIRIKNEEKVLSQKLDGYSDYKKKVKYRLVPFVW